MAKLLHEQQEAELSRKVTWFLHDYGKYRLPLKEVLADFRASDYNAYIFGGLLRDLMIGRLKSQPRDIDIVIGQTSADCVATTFSRYLKRRTRFGGLHLNNEGWLFDVWPLEETWAFRSGLGLTADFSELPKTTFLNVEAVAIELSSRPGKTRCVYSSGFFEGIANREVDINLEENPFPALCVVRSLITAARLQFSISSRLAKYIESAMQEIAIEELIEVQRHHYGSVKCSSEQLRMWQKAIHEQRCISKSSLVRLPGTEIRQLSLWDDANTTR